MHQLRASPSCRAAGKNAIGTSSDGVRGGGIGERELVTGVEMIFVLPGVAARLRKAPVDVALAGPGNQRHRGIEHAASSRRRIEPLPDEVAKKATRLRDTEHNRGLRTNVDKRIR